MKTYITEQTSEAYQIVEAKAGELPEGVLMRTIHPICNVGELNRNNRMYERKLWDRVLGDKDVAAKMESRSLFGLAEHPETSQGSLEKVSHVITRTWLDESANKMYQEFDILDTPYGRILETLLKAKCGVGVSTRADGELEEAVDESGKKYQRVLPESYQYISTDYTIDPSTFDVAPLSVKKNVMNSIKRDLKSEKIDKAFATSLMESISKSGVEEGYKEDADDYKELSKAGKPSWMNDADGKSNESRKATALAKIKSAVASGDKATIDSYTEACWKHGLLSEQEIKSVYPEFVAPELEKEANAEEAVEASDKNADFEAKIATIKNKKGGSLQLDNGVRLTLKKKVETDEWVVAYYDNGKYSEDKTYYTNDFDDAILTMTSIAKQENGLKKKNEAKTNEIADADGGLARKNKLSQAIYDKEYAVLSPEEKTQLDTLHDTLGKVKSDGGMAEAKTVPCKKCKGKCTCKKEVKESTFVYYSNLKPEAKAAFDKGNGTHGNWKVDGKNITELDADGKETKTTLVVKNDNPDIKAKESKIKEADKKPAKEDKPEAEDVIMDDEPVVGDNDDEKAVDDTDDTAGSGGGSVDDAPAVDNTPVEDEPIEEPIDDAPADEPVDAPSTSPEGEQEEGGAEPIIADITAVRDEMLNSTEFTEDDKLVFRFAYDSFIKAMNIDGTKTPEEVLAGLDAITATKMLTVLNSIVTTGRNKEVTIESIHKILSHAKLEHVGLQADLDKSVEVIAESKASVSIFEKKFKNLRAENSGLFTALESKATKLADMQKMLEAKEAELKALKESQVVELSNLREQFHKESIVDYVKQVTSTRKLTLPTNTVTLLSECQTKDEVDGLIESIVDTLRKDMLHSNSLTNVELHAPAKKLDEKTVQIQNTIRDAMNSMFGK